MGGGEWRCWLLVAALAAPAAPAAADVDTSTGHGDNTIANTVSYVHANTRRPREPKEIEERTFARALMLRRALET
ncbi:hypothetical protein EVAR_99843_1 [Eumeta japonica]|uniref:Uncharacterized protein n=1 Tax=Eumeta variegata TaxID=151549 RepID=A0A4C1ZDI3_EUMVA|nr:hypothetical protein EVAR_99843_1 [Eumeta japonica]